MTAITVGNIKTKYTAADSLHQISSAYLDSNDVLLVNFIAQSRMKNPKKYHIKTKIKTLHEKDAPYKKGDMLTKEVDRDLNTVSIKLDRSSLKKGHKKLKTTDQKLPHCITANNCIDRGLDRASQKTSSISLDFHHLNGKKYEMTIKNKVERPHVWQVLLVPLTLTADIITSPFQLTGYFILKSDLK